MRGILRAAIAAVAVLAVQAAHPQQSPAKDAAGWLSFCPTAGGNMTLMVKDGVVDGCSAFGFYNDTIMANGWGYLHVESNHALSSADQAYAAGVAEGYLTAHRIQQSLINTFQFSWTNGVVPQVVYDFTETQRQWVADQAKAQPNSAYWINAMFLYQQTQGLVDGVAMAKVPGDKPISLADMLVLNLVAEADDMQSAVDPAFREARDVLKMHDINKAKLTMELNSHCSAFIRLAPDLSDLFSAHTTWTGFANMLRTYKYINVAPTGTVAQGIQFSSYPGCLSSTDDYYQTSAGLIIIETTNNVINMSLYDYVTPFTIPTFVRTMMATRMANSGQEWTAIYGDNNSGTYNNQWMVVDNKRFTAGSVPSAGTLWVSSQIPGLVVSQDVTSVLISQGYWASYNVPYFPEIFDKLGYVSMVQQYGPGGGEYIWSYANNFRALLFARDAPNVHTVEGTMAIIRENNWQTDPLSHGAPDLAIAARTDLAPPASQSAFGAIDAKVSSASWMNAADGSMKVMTQCGPTTENQPPFRWSTSPFNSQPHIGMPDLFNFDWVEYTVTPKPAPTASA